MLCRSKITLPGRFYRRRANAHIFLYKNLLLYDGLVNIDYLWRGGGEGITVDHRHPVIDIYVLIHIGDVDLVDIYVNGIYAVPAVITAAVIEFSREQAGPMRHNPLC